MKHSHVPLFVTLALALFSGCSSASDPELEQAARVVGYMLVPMHLSRSSYAALYPDGKPSDFVSFMFSDIGVAEWPESEATAENDPMIREQARAIRAPLIPKNVVLVPRVVNPNLEKQAVVKFDDARSVVIVEGYVNPAGKPVMVREWKLPKVKAQVGVDEIAQGQLQLGMSDRSS